MAYADGAHPRESLLRPPPLDACGMARAVDLIGDRWSLLIIREALYGVTRFDAMQADLEIPRTVLSARLKRLCAGGLLTRRAYREPGQRTRYQYVLTSKGVDLAVAMIALMQWGDKHVPVQVDRLRGRDAPPRTEIVDRKTGASCRVSLVTESGGAVGVGETQVRILP